MRRRKIARSFEDMYSLTAGGAVLSKSTDVLTHAGSPVALAGDVSGLAQLGVAAGVGKVALDMALKPYRYKRKRR